VAQKPRTTTQPPEIKTQTGRVRHDPLYAGGMVLR
jgi:hypothetical protein